MFRKLFIPMVAVLVALSVTACGQVQLPGPPWERAAEARPNDLPDQAARPNDPPAGGPQSGRTPGTAGRAQAAFIQLAQRMGWQAGVVARTDDGQIVLRTGRREGDRVKVDAGTLVVIPGKTSAMLSDVQVGDLVVAQVSKGSAGASFVMIVPKDYDQENLLMGMTRKSVDGTIALRTRGGAEEVTTSGETQVFKMTREGAALGALSDLQSGNPIAVVGLASGEEFSAQVIFALPQGLKNFGGAPGNAPGREKKDSPPRNSPKRGN